MVDRLIYIIQQCPSIAQQALHLALTNVKTLRDPGLFSNLYQAYEVAVAAAAPGEYLPSWSDLSTLDQAFVEELSRRNMEDKVKLEVELKTYTSNMIKESIRVRCMLL